MAHSSAKRCCSQGSTAHRSTAFRCLQSSTDRCVGCRNSSCSSWLPCHSTHHRSNICLSWPTCRNILPVDVVGDTVAMFGNCNCSSNCSSNCNCNCSILFEAFVDLFRHSIFNERSIWHKKTETKGVVLATRRPKWFQPAISPTSQRNVINLMEIEHTSGVTVPPILALARDSSENSARRIW